MGRRKRHPEASDRPRSPLPPDWKAYLEKHDLLFFKGRHVPSQYPEPLRKARAADKRTTSLKLPDALLDRLNQLAHRSGITRHAIMKEAILRQVARMEVEEWLAAGRNGETDSGFGAGADGKRALFAYEQLMTPGTGLTEAMAAWIARGMHPLRAVRTGRGFTVQRLAARLNDLGIEIEDATLTAIEERKARASAELLVKLAEALGVSAEVLCG